MKQLNVVKSALGFVLAASLLTACEKGNRSFSILSDEAAFTQSPDYKIVPQKIDILFVVDNSGSMASLQQALGDNFNRFINRFQSLQFDYRIGITTSDAYVGKFWGDDSFRRLRDGAGANHSGVFVIDRNTADISNVFLTNVKQGISGSGDERAFSSFQDTLDYAGNSDFRRSDAFLAIIIVSDEDDFSATVEDYQNNNYSSPNLVPVANYKTFLDGFAGAGKYNVNAAAIFDDACLTTMLQSFGGRRKGIRYDQLVTLTGGTKTSLCDDFGSNLQLISDTLIEKNLQYSFVLDREPIQSSIVVKVNGATIPQDSNNGWTYDAATRTVTFHGTAIPQAGAAISITYDPLNPKG